MSKQNPALDDPYLSLLEPVKFTPIFVLGSPRSGTTLLYKLLAETNCFNYLSAYHLVKYQELLHNHQQQRQEEAQQGVDNLYARMGVSNRIFDQVKVDAQMPKEYRTVWQNSGNASPLKMLKKIVLQRKGFVDVLFDLGQLNEKHLLIFQEICRKIQFISDADKKLLLKNPGDFSNFLYIKQLFPEAKFIFIHRHPLAILHSQLRGLYTASETPNANLAIHSGFYRNALKNPLMRSMLQLFFASPLFSRWRLKLLSRILSRQQEGFIRDIDSLPVEDFISIRYEDLCEQPNTFMTSILTFLAVKPDRSTELAESVDYKDCIQPRSFTLLPELERFQQTKTYQEFEPYAAYHGYTL